MKRALIALLISLFAVSASAFDAEKDGGRRSIAILEVTADHRPGELVIGAQLATQVRNRLRKAGFDAFTISATLDEVKSEPRADVDFYVELAPWDADSNPYGGGSVGGRHGGVDIAIVRSRIAAELRVYDARTFDLLGTHDLAKRSTAVMPVAFGVGTRDVAAWVAVPLTQWWQYRRLTRRMAEDAAVRVAEIVRNPV